MKNILVVNSSSRPSEVIVNIFQKMEKRGVLFHLFSCNPDLLDRFPREKKGNRWVKRIRLGPGAARSKAGVMIFSLLLPFICLKQFITLFYLKFRKKISTVICFDWNDRLVFTPVAGFLGMKVVWLERPERRYKTQNKFLLALLRSLFRSVDKVIVFTEDSKQRLQRSGVSENKIKNVRLGVDPESRHQDDLFSNLARAGDSGASQTCFTVGVVADLDDMYQIENLFQSIKICLDIFSDIRIIIIGGGKNKKRVIWLARQYNLEDLIYLVGEQNDLEKWWESFDVYLSCVNSPCLRELQTVLEAMLAGLPVIAFHGQGLEEAVLDQEAGFIIPENSSEDLAQKIIYLQQHGDIRKRMGEQAHNRVKNNFTADKQLKELENEFHL